MLWTITDYILASIFSVCENTKCQVPPMLYPFQICSGVTSRGMCHRAASHSLLLSAALMSPADYIEVNVN